ncbi:Signal transducer and activator of transcription 2 [Anthophora quadrimaculata]
MYLLLLITTLTITTNADECIRIESCPLENSKNHTDHRPYPYDCHKFYKCNYGCGYLFECPYAELNPAIHLVFNPEKEVCDWPSNVPGQCSGTPPVTYPPQPPVTYPPQPPVTYPPQPPVTYPPQPPVTYPPQPPVTYPPQPPVTYPPQPPVTYPPQPPVTYPPYPGSILTRCPDVGRRYIAHESNCHYYYECNNADKKLRVCHENLIFNPYVEACDYPTFIRCITTGNLPG